MVHTRRRLLGSTHGFVRSLFQLIFFVRESIKPAGKPPVNLCCACPLKKTEWYGFPLGVCLLSMSKSDVLLMETRYKLEHIFMGHTMAQRIKNQRFHVSIFYYNYRLLSTLKNSDMILIRTGGTRWVHFQ